VKRAGAFSFSTREFIKPETATAIAVFGASAILLAAMRLADPSFGSLNQLTAILTTSIFLVVASFGQGLVILAGRGGIDLSVGVVSSIAGMLIAGLAGGLDAALWWATPLALLCCCGIGFFNGVGVAVFNVPPFIMTLASAAIFYGVGLGATSGRAQQSVAPALQQLMSGYVGPIPTPIALIVVFVAVAIVFQNHTTYGRKIYAIGSNPVAAHISGLPIVRLTILVYVISGLCAGIAGLLLAGYSSSATLVMGDSLLLPTIAAVVIGGARISGGKGIYLGTFAGALFLSTLATIITVLSLSQGWRNIIQGGIIVIALVLQSRTWGKG
jgi:ribose transport system permease protein